MEGLNLSSSIVEKKEKKGAFDSSFVVVSIIFFLVVASFGGLRWYIKTLDDTLAKLDATLQERSLLLHGDSVNRVANFNARLGVIEQQLKVTPVDSQKLLSQLEGLVLPQVRVTKYEYNKTSGVVEVAGETNSFKYVAQQMFSFKSEDPFSKIRVNTLKRTDSGAIAFSFKAQL